MVEIGDDKPSGADVSLACPLCRSPDPEVFLQRSGMPVHQNLVMADERSALDAPKGDLKMAACARCGFVFNAAFDASLLAYGEDYDNTQTCYTYFAAYMGAVVRLMQNVNRLRHRR